MGGGGKGRFLILIKRRYHGDVAKELIHHQGSSVCGFTTHRREKQMDSTTTHHRVEKDHLFETFPRETNVRVVDSAQNNNDGSDYYY